MSQQQGKLCPLILTLCLLMTPSVMAWEARINCGGPPEPTAWGDVFGGDRPWNPGSSGFIGGEPDGGNNQPITNTQGGERIFHVHRRGMPEYRFDLPNGSYAVTLYFADTMVHGPGLRVFDVLLEGTSVLTDFDVVATVGMAAGYVRGFHVDVYDGQLNILFPSKEGQAMISAIEVVSFGQDATPPPSPPALELRGSYRRNVLDWPSVVADDLAGYAVDSAPSASGPWTTITPELLGISRYYDDTVIPGEESWYRVRAVDIFGNSSAGSVVVSATARARSQATLPVYQLTLDEQDWKSLNADPTTDDEVPASFTSAGDTWNDVETRYRGNISRRFAKKSWKIKFLDELFGDRDRLNLNSEYVDWSMIRCRLGFDLFADSNVPSPAASPVLLDVNDIYFGVFDDMQQIDELFLEQTGLDSNSSIYKANDRLKKLGSYDEYVAAYEKKTNASTGHQDLIDFIELINDSSDEEFPSAISSVMDVEEYLAYYAHIIFQQNTDFTMHNYYLTHDLNQGVWRIIPWDLDHTFGIGGAFDHSMLYDRPIDVGRESTSDRIIGGPNNLVERMMRVPRFKRIHVRNLNNLAAGPYTAAEFDPAVDAEHAEIQQDAHLDVNKQGQEDNAEFDASVAQLKTWVSDRRAFVLGEIDPWAPDDDYDLVLNEVMPANGSTITDEAGEYDDWVEIHNLGSRTVMLENLYLTDDPSDPTQWSFPTGASIDPGAFLLVWCDKDEEQGDLHTNFKLSASGEELLLIAADGITEIDRISFSELSEDEAFGSYPDGSFYHTIQSVPTPGASNDAKWNTPPSLVNTKHIPAFPAAGEEVNITVQVSDADGVGEVTLRYDVRAGRVDLPMADDGLSGDGDAGDGLYGAMIPGQVDGTVVHYHVWASDRWGASATDPPGAPEFTWRYVAGYEPPSVRINEVLASNDKTNVDEAGEADDWVELWNSGTETVELAGKFLSDDPLNPTQWEFPAGIVIPSGAHLIVWCDKDEEQGELHTSFKLSKSGETVGLYESSESSNVAIDEISFPQLDTDLSYSRIPDGSSAWEKTAPPTPEMANEPSLTIREVSSHAFNTVVDVSWIGASRPAAGFNVYGADSVDGPFSLLTDPAKTSSPFRDTGLTNGVTRYYRVVPVDRFHREGVPSDVVSAMPDRSGGTTPVTDLRVTYTGSDINLSWSVVTSDPELSLYRVYRDTSPLVDEELDAGLHLLAEVSEAAFTDSGAASGPETWFYEIRTLDLSGEQSED